MGMCFTQVIAMPVALWGGPPGPQRTPSPAHRLGGQGRSQAMDWAIVPPCMGRPAEAGWDSAKGFGNPCGKY